MTPLTLSIHQPLLSNEAYWESADESGFSLALVLRGKRERKVESFRMLGVGDI
jgi:hypothetical protein